LEILTKTYKPRNRYIKARNGSVLTDEKGILNRWKEHFKGEQIAQPFEFYENESLLRTMHKFVNFSYKI